MTSEGGASSGAAMTAAAFVLQALPLALQVARRVARTTRVLDADELEGIARLTIAELAPLFDPSRGSLKAFVATRVSFSLLRALRRERRCANVEAEDAIHAGLAHVEGMVPRVDAAWISDEDAYAQLGEMASEVADVMALHSGAPDLIAEVRQALADLSPFEGRVVAMHYLERKSFRQIAAELDCTHIKAYRAHESALPVLRRKLRGWEPR